MKKIFVLVSSFVLTIGQAFSAQLDPKSQAELRHAMMPAAAAHRMAPAHGATTMLALVRLDDSADASELEADEAYDVHRLRGPFAVVSCAPADAVRLASHKAVKRCEFNRKRTMHLSQARLASGIDKLHSGIELPQSYTGKGVVTGIVDGGFDPNHINFRNPDGSVGFDYFFDLEITNAGQVRNTVYDSQKLKSYITDDRAQTHGTHTLGIMAGRYQGPLTASIYDAATDKAQVSELPSPYYGVAPESSILAASGAAYEATIAYGLDAILDYRWNEGYQSMPIVVNMSLGGNSGPHDGTGMLAQYLDWAQDNDGMISVISAGNEGDKPIALNHTFAEDGEEVKTFIRPHVYTDMRYGSVEIYSDTDEAFDISVVLYNSKRGTVARTFPLANRDGIIQYICSSDYKQESTDIIDETFAKAYEGYVGLVGTYNEESGRFYAFIDYYAVNTADNEPDEDTTAAQYTLGFVVKGKAGQRIDCYCDGEFTHLDSYGIEGYSNGMRNGSISDMATCKTAISVGSYNTCEYVGGLGGEVLGYDGYYKQGEVTEFSSFGTLPDGRCLPHIVAPGCMVVSSMSTPYIEDKANEQDPSKMTANCKEANRNNYFAGEIGTSMSAPVVAGTIALWLEADPTLDYADCIEILQKTAVKDAYWDLAADPVQWGAGKLDAYAGLKEVLLCSGIADIKADTGKLVLAHSGSKAISVLLPGARNLDVKIYNMAGQCVCAKRAIGCEAVVDAQHLAAGVYVVTVNGRHASRIIIR